MQLLILFLVLGVLLRLFEPRIKGYLGEAAVASRLGKLPQEHYRVFNDIMLQTKRGTTQIDHIVVSIYGIFVIETKNYKGWITGSEFAEQWTKNMYGKKYAFRNPLKQNYAHVKALEDKFNLSADKFIPIVAFSGNATIKVNTSKPVIYIGQLQRVIQGYTEVKFSSAELDDLVKAIQSEDVTSKDNRKAHVKQIKNQVRENNLKVEQGVCPKCGRALVKRKGKYGEFIGCSNYPKCRYKLSK